MRAFRRLIRTIFLILTPATAFFLTSQLVRSTSQLITVKVLNIDIHRAIRHTENHEKLLERHTETHEKIPERKTETHENIPERHNDTKEKTGETPEGSGSEIPPFTRLLNDKAYLYSAVFIPRHHNGSQQNSSFPSNFKAEIVINGWERKGQVDAKSACCILLKAQKTIQRVAKTQKLHWVMLQSKLHATQFRCPTNEPKSNIIGLSITYSPGCSKNTTEYVTISDMEVAYSRNSVEARNIATEGNATLRNSNTPSIGVCAKLAYGDLDAKRLVEWFEVHRMFGVDTVIAYSYKLNKMARKVFDYYETLGMSKLFEYDIPQKDEIKRDVGTKNVQSWNDEQVALYDCQERLQAHDYVAVMDTDEFMVPVTNNFNNVWRKFLKEQFRPPTLSSITFKVQIHVTSWERNMHPLFIGQYINSTKAMFDRVKEAYMPSRVTPGTVSTHFLKPLPQFRRKYVPPKIATIHHYRSCRKEWLKPIDSGTNINKHVNGTKPEKKKSIVKCSALEQNPSKLMLRLANAVKKQVLLANKNIGL